MSETISENPPFHKHAVITIFLKALKGEHPRGVEFTDSGLRKMLESFGRFNQTTVQA